MLKPCLWLLDLLLLLHGACGRGCMVGCRAGTTRAALLRGGLPAMLLPREARLVPLARSPGRHLGLQGLHVVLGQQVQILEAAEGR